MLFIMYQNPVNVSHKSQFNGNIVIAPSKFKLDYRVSKLEPTLLSLNPLSLLLRR